MWDNFKWANHVIFVWCRQVIWRPPQQHRLQRQRRINQPVRVIIVLLPLLLLWPPQCYPRELHLSVKISDAIHAIRIYHRWHDLNVTYRMFTCDRLKSQFATFANGSTARWTAYAITKVFTIEIWNRQKTIQALHYRRPVIHSIQSTIERPKYAAWATAAANRPPAPFIPTPIFPPEKNERKKETNKQTEKNTKINASTAYRQYDLE